MRSMDDQTLFDRQYASLREFCRLLGRAAPDSQVVERDGVLAAVVPAAPDRSVVNSVVYEDAAELERALPELAAAYEEAGVRPGRSGCRTTTPRRPALLERAGHVLDADPEAMAMELAALEAPRPADLDLDPEPDLATVARSTTAPTLRRRPLRARRCGPLRHCTATSRASTGARCAARRATTTTATSRSRSSRPSRRPAGAASPAGC